MRVVQQINAQASGIILLKYKGPNSDWINRKCIKEAQLFLNYKNYIADNKQVDLKVEFNEFLNIKLKLDFSANSVEKPDLKDSIIGNVELKQICIDSYCFIISGEYHHQSIALAYQDNNIVEFDLIVNLIDIDSGFLGFIKILKQSKEFNSFFFDYR